jgi:hypothetical protein
VIDFVRRDAVEQFGQAGRVRQVAKVEEEADVALVSI